MELRAKMTKLADDQVEVEVGDAMAFIAQRVRDEWVLTYTEVCGVPQYSCLAEFSSRVLSPEATSLVDAHFANMKEKETKEVAWDLS